MGTGPTLHTRASLALVGGVGWKGMRPGCARTSGVAAVYRLGIPWPSVKGISFATRVGKRAISPVYAQTAHTPREWLRAWLKRSLSRPLTPYHMMLLSSPQCPTLAPRWRLCSPFVSDLSLIELAETASLPTEAEQDKTAEMVLAEWHAAQDAACTGSPVATPAIGDTSRAPSQPAQETLSGPDSDSPMEDCTTALLVV
ncbi:hypothetical protein BSL78_04002 [Apostichopus japonicus]|uniref:Uncharacterized protein n=1 Tax=Stichopus japonicus TaxID=307972 RepID=A0A2G8LFL9_STIJA|nr:hypothetical protein BSL78_04002 [Apostichopus japonicus]